jgi:3-hydroxybutyryl-CoA dehydrogenase
MREAAWAAALRTNGETKRMAAKVTTDKPVAVIGAGTMGRGIIQVFAQAGFEVRFFDAHAPAMDAALGYIRKFLDKGVEKGKVERKDADAAMTRMHPVGSLAEIGSPQLAIEAVVEQLEPKIELHQKLDEMLNDRAIQATNTSSISISKLAAATSKPHRFIGMHFFNPVPLMELVEVVAGLDTDAETVARTCALAEAVGKKPLKVRDNPGFVSNRVLMPLINEATRTLMEGVADAETIDGVMTMGCGHKMGPLRTADLIGLDVCLDIMEVMHRDLGDDRFAPCPLLRTMVAARRLGMKTKRGFYEDYDK